MKYTSVNGFYQVLKAKKITETFTDDDGNDFIRLKDPTGAGYAEHCPLHMPLAYMENPSVKRSVKTANVDPEEKLREYSKQCHRGHITNACIKSALKLWQSYLSVFMMKKDNQIEAFESNANGTKRKALEDREKIAVHARRATLLYPNTLFLTLTERVEPGKTDIIEQYRAFGKEQSEFLAFLVKRFNCVYEVVSESTKKGYRHAHIVLHFKHMPDVNKVVKRKFKSDVYGGELREWIKSHWTRGTSKLELSEKRSPITYLLKYVTKMAYSEIKSLSEDSHELSDDERKSALTLLNPIVSRTRRYNLSHFSKEEILATDEIINKEAEKKRTKLQVTKATYKPSKPCRISLLRPRRSLDSPCINSESPCTSFIRAMGLPKFRKATFGEVEEFKNLPDEFKAKIFKTATPLSCQGCIFTHWRNEVLNGNDPWFHKDSEKDVETQFAEGGDYWKYTDEELEKREKLLKKYDERVLPLIVDDMKLTFYKKVVAPQVKITFSEKLYVPTMDEKGYEDLRTGSGTAKIHKYLLNPRARRYYSERLLEYTEDPILKPMSKEFYKNDTDKWEYKKYADREQKQYAR